MDGRGRLAQSVKRPSRAGRVRADHVVKEIFLSAVRAAARAALRHGPRAYAAVERHVRAAPQAFGRLATAGLFFASVGYGIVKGDHLPTIGTALKEARDGAANAVGFRIEYLAIAGRKQLTEDDVLAAAGLTRRSSLLFLDVAAARRNLEAAPWIAHASVRKLYPGSLEIAIEERAPFAIWQQSGKLSIIAADGTVLGPLGVRPAAGLPLVVGPGAAQRAREFLAIVDEYPQLKDQVRASILVAERRWNLKLKSGLDIRLPESEMRRALDALVALDRERNILSRDIAAIDLRLPQRITVRLSDEAAQAREQQLQKEKKAKAKGGNA